jgi:hypothetical protein
MATATPWGGRVARGYPRTRGGREPPLGVVRAPPPPPKGVVAPLGIFFLFFFKKKKKYINFNIFY